MKLLTPLKVRAIKDSSDSAHPVPTLSNIERPEDQYQLLSVFHWHPRSIMNNNPLLRSSIQDTTLRVTAECILFFIFELHIEFDSPMRGIENYEIQMSLMAHKCGYEFQQIRWAVILVC